MHFSCFLFAVLNLKVVAIALSLQGVILFLGDNIGKGLRVLFLLILVASEYEVLLSFLLEESFELEHDVDFGWVFFEDVSVYFYFLFLDIFYCTHQLFYNLKNLLLLRFVLYDPPKNLDFFL